MKFVQKQFDMLHDFTDGSLYSSLQYFRSCIKKKMICFLAKNVELNTRIVFHSNNLNLRY